MASRMVTLNLEPSTANLPFVRKKFGLKPDDADESFGVVCVSPAENLYAILAEEGVAAKLEAAHGAAGVFSNPKIEPFGPPR